MSRNVGLGGSERYDSLRGKLLVINARAIFCWFLFSIGIEKRFDLVQSLHIRYELHRKISKLLLMSDLG